MKTKYRFTWFGLVALAFIVTTACGLFGSLGNVAEQAGGARGTIEAMVTDMDDFATQAVDFATQASESGLVGTAQAMVTQMDSEEILATLGAVGTQFPGAAEELQATAMAAMEDINTGEVPPDIPLISPSEENFFSNNSFVSYNTTADFDSVVDFYQQQMPTYGWEAGEGEVQTNNTAILQYTKEGRRAAIALSVNPGNNHTLVVISILDF